MIGLQWKTGDRAAFEHSVGGGRGRKRHVDHGTVTAVDERGLPPGVRLTFDEPCCLGAESCYALSRELYRSSKPREVAAAIEGA